MHSPKPLSASKILKTMPTNKSIDDIYKKMTAKKQLEILSLCGEMQLYGANYIIRAIIRCTGISHTHFLSYSPIISIKAKRREPLVLVFYLSLLLFIEPAT